MKRIAALVTLCLASAANAGPTSAEPFGRVALSGIYASETTQADDEELDGSALVARGDAGVTHRRWSWDERLTADGNQRRERLWLPQLRLTRQLGDRFEFELDYRRVIRRSNDPNFDRNGNRLAATLRKDF